MAKAHSRWSASASSRNMACPGSLALSEDIPSTTSIYAAWGTAGHTMSEECIVNDRHPGTYLGTFSHVDGFRIEVDEDMVDATQICIDYVRSLADKPGAELWLEETFDLAPLEMPLEAGGTSDAVVWLPEEATIEIVDYKFGRGKIVEVVDNTQLSHYGLGALVKHPELPATKVRLTIIQPRAPHPDGVIRSAEMHVSDMVDFANDINEAMHRSALAITELKSGVNMEAWGNAWLHPGDHCQFCPAAGNCPALRVKAQEMVGAFWDEIGGTEIVAIASDNAPTAVERDLEMFDLIEHWIAERRAYAHQLAEGGHEFSNWVLVEKNGHRKWNEPDKVTAAAIVDATGLADVELYTQKLKSPAGIEKLLGAGKEKIADLYHKPVIGKDLVRRSKAVNRQPAKSLVDTFFNS